VAALARAAELLQVTRSGVGVAGLRSLGRFVGVHGGGGGSRGGAPRGGGSGGEDNYYGGDEEPF